MVHQITKDRLLCLTLVLEKISCTKKFSDKYTPYPRNILLLAGWAITAAGSLFTQLGNLQQRFLREG